MMGWVRGVWCLLAAVLLVVVVDGDISQGTQPTLLTEAAGVLGVGGAGALPSLPSVSDLMSWQGSGSGDRPLNTVGDLEAFVEELKGKAEVVLAKAFRERLGRRRRELSSAPSVNVSGTAPHRFPFNPSSSPLTALHVLEDPATTTMYFTLGTYRNQRQKVVEVAGPRVREAEFVLDPTSSTPVDRILSILHYGYLWIVFATAYMDSMAVGCINLANFKSAVPQRLPVHYLGALHFFTAGGYLYLVVGEKQIASVMYKLEMVKKFDQMEHVRLKKGRVKAITSFQDGNTRYIVLGMAAEEGSLVYSFDEVTETVKLVQEVQDKQVIAAHTFLDPQDNKRYLALLNANAALRIYWWNRDQLQEWQTIASPWIDSRSSMAVVNLANLEHILCVAHQSSFTFYTEDLSGHYTVNFVVQTHCSNVFGLHAVKVGREEHVLVFLCDRGAAGPVTLQGMRLLLSENVPVQSATRTDELLACLRDVTTSLEAREDGIARLNSSVAALTHIPSGSQPQVWQGPISFSQGLTVSGTTTFMSQLTLQPPRDAIVMPDSQLTTRIQLLQESVSRLVNDSNSVLYYREDQSFPGPVTAQTLRVDSAHFGTLKMGRLNGLNVSRLEQEVLLMGVDQQLHVPPHPHTPTTLTLHSLNAHTLTTHTAHPAHPATINGIRTADLMQKNKMHQEVTGKHRYMHITVMGSIVARPSSSAFEFKINGVPISSLVRRGASSVTFQGQKTIKRLVVMSGVNVRLVNGVSLREVAQEVVYTDVAQQQVFDGVVQLGAVEVAGNVDVQLINGVDLRHLDSNTVKVTGDFALQGPVRFMKSLNITGNLYTSQLNEVPWNSLLLRQAPRSPIASNFVFSSAFVHHEVFSDNVNGLDLSEDVVLMDSMQTIYGRITFLSDVTVTGPEGVVMEEGVTVNNVDLSLLLDRIEGTGKLIVSEPIALNQPLTCSGDITAVNINGLPLKGIQHRYWRKSVPQVIDVPVKLARAEFMAPVTGDNLNGLQMTDFLTTNTNQIINGSYVFMNNVEVVGNLHLGEGSTVNNVDVLALNRSVVTLHGDQTIFGTMTFDRLTVAELDVSGTLNGVDPRTGYLLLNQSRQHTERLTFLGETVASHLSLGGDLRVDTLNGVRPEQVARELVLHDQDATIIGPHTLHFAGNITVVNLEVRGTVDGVDINAVLSNALLRTPPPGTLQEVTGRLHVTGSVHFTNQLNLNTANGKHFISHLQNVVTRDYTGLIEGKKTFLQPVAVQHNLDASTINGVNMREFTSQVFTKSGDQVITAHYTFTSSVTFEHLSTPIINNISMSRVLLVDTPGHLADTTTFLAPLTITGHLKSGSTTLAGCDLAALAAMKLERGSDGSLHVHGPLRVDHLYVNGSLDAPAGLLVGGSLSLDFFLNNLVLKSKKQTIYGQVEFLSNVEVQSMSTQTLNGVDVTEMFRQSVQYNEEEIIRCSLEFEHPIRVARVVVRGPVQHYQGGAGTGGELLVGGVSVARVAAQAIRVGGGRDGQAIVVTGHKSFSRGFTSHNLIVDGSFDGVAVGDLVRLGGGVSRTLTAATFLQPITVHGDLQVHGLVDGVMLSEVFSSRVSLLQPGPVSGRCHFHALKVLGNVDVEVINDVTLSDLVLREGRGQQVVVGAKTFAGGLVVEGAIKTSLLNGVDVAMLNQSLVRLDRPLVIKNKVTFKSVVVAERAVGGAVQGHDASILARHLQQFVAASNDQYKKLLEVHHSIKRRVAVNLAMARDMFTILHHLAWSHSQLLPSSSLRHHLSSHQARDVGSLLVVKECSEPCVCPSQTSLYKVWQDGSRPPQLFLNSSGPSFFLSATSLNLSVTLHVLCVGDGKRGVVTLDGLTGEHSLSTDSLSLGVVADAGIFVVGNVAYVVTAGRLDKGSDVARAWLVVLRVSHDHQRLEQVWRYELSRSAAKIDLTQVGSSWFLLLVYRTNPYKSDRYATPAALFEWSAQQEVFTFRRHYSGRLASSAMFFSAPQPFQEHFFILAQRRAAGHHADTRVLVYKHSEDSGHFEEFQVLPVSNVLDHSVLVVGSSPYLLLLSEEERLDVFIYIPGEGLRLQQSVGVHGAVSLAVLKGEDGQQQVWVSTEAPARLEVFTVVQKGVDPSRIMSPALPTSSQPLY